jgi:hypothetical protein
MDRNTEASSAGPAQLARDFYSDIPFDERICLYDGSVLRMDSAKNLAYKRIQTGRNSFFSSYGCRVREGCLFVPERLAGKASIVILRESPLIKDPVGAVNAHKNSNYAKIPDDKAMKIYEEAKSENESENYHVLESTEPVPTDQYENNPAMSFIYQEIAKEYGFFLRGGTVLNCGNIQETEFKFDNEHIINKHGPYINQLCIGMVGRGSDISSQLNMLHYNTKIFWELTKPAKKPLEGLELCVEGLGPRLNPEKTIEFLEICRRRGFERSSREE